MIRASLIMVTLVVLLVIKVNIKIKIYSMQGYYFKGFHEFSHKKLKNVTQLTLFYRY